MVEQRLPIFVGQPEEQFGTSDAVILLPHRLRVVDLKYGRGVQVYASTPRYEFERNEDGSTTPVEVGRDPNEQLMLYALGALDEFSMLADFDDVELVIHQPRLNHVDTHVVTVAELREFEQQALAAARSAIAVAASVEDGYKMVLQDLAPGDKQCQFCKAKGHCPALRDKVLALVAGDFNTPEHDLYQDGDPGVPDAICDGNGQVALGLCKRCGKAECELDGPCSSPEPMIDKLKRGEVAVTITEAERILAAAYGVAPKAVDFVQRDSAEPGLSSFIVRKPTLVPALADPEARVGDLAAEQLAMCMEAVDLVEGWAKAVRAEVERRLVNGGDVPGFKLVEGRKGARAWSDPNAAEALFKTFRLKQDQMYDFTLISPTTAEKLAADGLIGKKQWPKAQALITQSSGKPSVAPASDKRPAIPRAADDFNQPDDVSDLL
jgi:hypothetical protein